MLTTIALLGLLAVPTPRALAHDALAGRPRIEVWSSHGDGVYTRGQGVRVYFRTDQDAFVTLFRVDTDGRVRVLFPRDPWEDNFVRGGREFEVQGSGERNAFYVDDYAGVGYLFGVAAADPFEYGAIESGDHWDYRAIADGRVRGDPYVALTELAERIVPEGYADWDYDIVPYHVERQHDYPRFLCYDCHAYVSYPYWDPYWRSCVRFRIVRYDDPYYYPYRYYGGRRVVFVRPFRPQPRFVFKDRDGSGRDRFVTREPNRPVNDETRRAPTRRETGTTGVIPAPRDMPRRERPATVESGSALGPRRPDQPNRPDDDRGRRGRERSVRPDEGKVPTAPGRVEPRGQGRSTDRSDNRDKAQRAPAAVPRREPTPRGGTPREVPRAEPRGDPQREQRRAEAPRAERPRAEPRAAPQREQPRAERPRSEPKARAEPKAREKGQQPELRRRKP
jgi:hypothetical protein